jgi:hypothetical protein
MAMDLLSFHDQFVAYLSAHEEHDNFAFIDIIQDTKASRAQFKFGEQIRAQLLNRLRRCGRLVLQPGHDSRFQDSLLA